MTTLPHGSPEHSDVRSVIFGTKTHLWAFQNCTVSVKTLLEKKKVCNGLSTWSISVHIAHGRWRNCDVLGNCSISVTIFGTLVVWEWVFCLVFSYNLSLRVCFCVLRLSDQHLAGPVIHIRQFWFVPTQRSKVKMRKMRDFFVIFNPCFPLF